MTEYRKSGKTLLGFFYVPIGEKMNYKNKKWQRTRTQILKRDEYTCQYFKRFGKLREANTVHHVIPTGERPDLAYERALMVSLSAEAHNKMHDRNTDELTDEGLKLAERTISKLSEDEKERLKIRYV